MPLALFDLDDTLIDGDCATLWGRYMTELGWVEKTAFLHQERRLMELYAEGRLAMEDYMDFSLAPIAGRPLTVIYQSLREQIERGLLARGSKLPSERQLSELFSTTRITLREALGQLEDQGLIYREERRGWFVSPQRLLYNPLVRSHFHAMVADQGRVPETEVLGAAMIPASVDICQRLELPALSRVFQIRRARRVDGRLVLYVEHYLNPAYFPGIERFDLTRSLTDLYANHYGIRYGRVRFEMVPTILPAEAAGPLRVSVGSPALQIVRINRDQAGRLIDCDLEYWRHDALQVNVEVPE